ncbi:MAG: STAS domain-containing protein [Chloroflexota bacterium]
MEVTIRALKSVDLVEVAGRVDSVSAPRLDQALKDLMQNGRYKIALDLKGVEYMSSSGLRAIVSCLREVHKPIFGGNLVIVQPSERVRDVLEISGLDSVLNVYDDQVGAIGSF